jgi:hypothetical protein
VHAKKVCLGGYVSNSAKFALFVSPSKIKEKWHRSANVLICNIRTISVLYPYCFHTISVLSPYATQNEHRGALF